MWVDALLILLAVSPLMRVAKREPIRDYEPFFQDVSELDEAVQSKTFSAHSSRFRAAPAARPRRARQS
jgi:hypothetical protein